MDLGIYFQRTQHPQQAMSQNRKIKEKKIVLAAKPLISLPIPNLRQTDNDADDISINVNIDNRAKESDQGDKRNGIADITIINWSMAQFHVHKILQFVCSTNPERFIAFEQML